MRKLYTLKRTSFQIIAITLVGSLLFSCKKDPTTSTDDILKAELEKKKEAYFTTLVGSKYKLNSFEDSKGQTLIGSAEFPFELNDDAVTFKTKSGLEWDYGSLYYIKSGVSIAPNSYGFSTNIDSLYLGGIDEEPVRAKGTVINKFKIDLIQDDYLRLSVTYKGEKVNRVYQKVK
ncbi:MAG: hypothetical protein WBP45_14875 [Daejeonella sp.]